MNKVYLVIFKYDNGGNSDCEPIITVHSTFELAENARDTLLKKYQDDYKGKQILAEYVEGLEFNALGDEGVDQLFEVGGGTITLNIEELEVI